MPTSVHLRIHGQVQGVSFRWYARREAQALGLAGWVRNCPDGTVEAVAEGSEEDVRRFVAWANHGPSGACVDRVEEAQLTPQGLAEFRIEP
jgi:acylphosphatase